MHPSVLPLSLALLLLAPSAAADETSIRLRDVTQRVESFHPALRARAAARLRAEVALRRANWDRVQGVAGINGGHAVTGRGLAATSSTGSTNDPWTDGFSAQLYTDLRLPLYAGGAISNGIDAADARVDAAREDAIFSREDLKRTALVAYASALAANRSVVVAQSALDRARDLVRLAETRHETGVGVAADIARGRLNAVRRQEELVGLEGNVAIAFATLRAALVLPEGAQIALVDPLEDVAIFGGGSSKDNYPEIAAEAARTKAAEADAKVARAGYLPRLDLFASGTYETGFIGGSSGWLGQVPVAVPQTDRFQPFHGEVSTGFVVTWRGFDMFIVRDRIAQADANVEIARANRAEVERVVVGRRAEARARENRARERVSVLAAGDDVATEAVRLARARYETGNTILTEVLDSELDRIAVQARRVDAAYELAVAHIERLRAEGSFL